MKAGRELELDCLRALTSGKDAWPRFVTLFGSFLYHQFRHYGIEPGAQRDDLLQEVALILMSNNWKPLRTHLARGGEHSFTAVLSQIVRSVVIDDWRRNKKWNGLAELDGQLDLLINDSSAWGSDPADLDASRRWVTTMLKQATENSDDQTILALYLRFAEGESVTVIGERVGLSPNAVSQRLRYYTRKLREIVGRGKDDA